jgi:hypothetical protein
VSLSTHDLHPRRLAADQVPSRPRGGGGPVVSAITPSSVWPSFVWTRRGDPRHAARRAARAHSRRRARPGGAAAAACELRAPRGRRARPRRARARLRRGRKRAAMSSATSPGGGQVVGRVRASWALRAGRARSGRPSRAPGRRRPCGCGRCPGRSGGGCRGRPVLATAFSMCWVRSGLPSWSMPRSATSWPSSSEASTISRPWSWSITVRPYVSSKVSAISPPPLLRSNTSRIDGQTFFMSVSTSATSCWRRRLPVAGRLQDHRVGGARPAVRGDPDGHDARVVPLAARHVEPDEHALGAGGILRPSTKPARQSDLLK